MKQKTLLAATALFLASLGSFFTPSSSYAASQDECAIWICLPGGFPSGCSAAHKAMIKRIKDFKSPLPSFSSCAISGGSKMSHDYNVAALIAEHRVCTETVWEGGRDGSERCVKWKTIPSHYVKGVRCRVDRDGDRHPRHCIGTYRYVDVFIDGKPAGDTYYWR